MNDLEEFETQLEKPLSKQTKETLKKFIEFMNPKETIFNKPKKIAFIHEDVGHLTGGRYYTWFLASALCEIGHDVTIYTNRQPVFLNEFRGYKRPRVVIASMNARRLSRIDVKADIYIGSPIQGALASTILGRKYDKPSFALIFDPFPAMEKFLNRKMYIGWDELIENLRNSNTKIISLCKSMSKFIYLWLNKEKDEVIDIYPCINSKVFDLKNREYKEKENYVVFVSRMVRHKRFEDVVSAVSKTNLRLKVISSISGMNYQQPIQQNNMKDRVDFHWKCSDDEKFDIIAKSKGVIVGSIFEGWGMYATEAITCGVPFIGYDYPTFREMEKFTGVNNFYLAKFKNPFDFGRQLKKALREKKYNKPSPPFHFEKMIERLKTINV